ncbi:MAG: hypothetical protein H7Z72_13650 [Bacteroidetes bacterium]|nr:hypothetical protein [Fibrella sp.]
MIILSRICCQLFDSRPTLIVNSFCNNSQLKPRIQMLVNPKTNRRDLWWYVLVLPLLVSLIGLTAACDRMMETMTGVSGDGINLTGRVVDSRKEPVEGVRVFVQSPAGRFATDSQGKIERAGGNVITDQLGQYKVTGIDSAAMLEFIHPAYIVTVLPLKQVLAIRQVPLFTMAETLKLRSDIRARGLIPETTKLKKP